MTGTDLVVRFGASKFGREVDVLVARATGHSLVNALFSRAYGAPYNKPLVLTTTGRRTGRVRSVVLPFFAAGEGAGADPALARFPLAIVGSRGGTRVDPQWAHNLRATPEATVHIDRRAHRVRVHEATGDERERLWRDICARAPVYAEYQRRAKTRTIPVFVLSPAGDGVARA